MSVRRMDSDMDSTTDEEHVLVTVELPSTLRADLDSYALGNDYRSTDPVVAEAIDGHL